MDPLDDVAQPRCPNCDAVLRDYATGYECVTCGLRYLANIDGQSALSEATRVFDVEVSREGRWWMVRIPEIDGLTQARSEDQVRRMARDYIALTLDVPAGSFELRVKAV